MNTVMDDNKMLTLASNERIPLTPTMRLLLEINHMNHCSPATVSRGGVIFVNAEDVGWKPMVDSWIEKLEVRLLVHTCDARDAPHCEPPDVCLLLHNSCSWPEYQPCKPLSAGGFGAGLTCRLRSTGPS